MFSPFPPPGQQQYSSQFEIRSHLTSNIAMRKPAVGVYWCIENKRMSQCLCTLGARLAPIKSRDGHLRKCFPQGVTHHLVMASPSFPDHVDLFTSSSALTERSCRGRNKSTCFTHTYTGELLNINLLLILDAICPKFIR